MSFNFKSKLLSGVFWKNHYESRKEGNKEKSLTGNPTITTIFTFSVCLPLMTGVISIEMKRVIPIIAN